MKVLIVDDDESTLTMLRLELARADCQVTGTLDPAVALKTLKEMTFDWLVVDGQMSPIDGFELAARAKEMQPGIKTVMISGVYDMPDILGQPIRKLFQKPIDVEALAAYIHEKDPSGR
jgi:DNA-binding NtrC family response regulator